MNQPADFSAAGIRTALQRRAAEKAAEARVHAAQQSAQQAAMRQAFESAEVPPDALERCIALVQRAIEQGEPQALVLRFPSDFMKDSGRCLSSGYGDWRGQLTGFAARGFAWFERELAPRGFALRARILDYPDGMPGQVGLFLAWE